MRCRCVVAVVWGFLSAAPLLPAQTLSELDSLEQRLPSVYGEARLALLQELASRYLRIELQKAQLFAEEAIELSQTLGSRKSHASALETLGLIYEKKSQYSDALRLHHQAMDIRQAIGDSLGVASSLNHIGSVYLAQNRSTEALEYYLQSLRIKEQLHHRLSLGITLSNISNLYYELGNVSEALRYQERAFEIAKELNDKTGIATALNNIANIYDDQNRIEDAKSYYEQALEICREIGDQVGAATVLNNLGYAEERNGNFTKALLRYQEALTLKEKIGNKSTLAITQQSIAELYEKMGNYTAALDFGKKALTNAYQAGSMRTVAQVYELLARIEAKCGNYKAAFEYSLAFARARDSVLNESSAKQLAEIQEKYESEKRQREIARLQHEKEIQALALSREILLRNSLIGIALLAFALALTAYRAYQNKRKTEAALKEKNAALNAALKVAEEQRQIAEEASRIKTELLSIAAHDLKNPLQSVVGFAELASEELSQLSCSTEFVRLNAVALFLQRIHSSAQRMSELISHLLQTAALESGQIRLNRRLTNLSELLSLTISDAEVQARRKSQTIHTCIQPNCFAEVDASWIREVFENLLSNAIKYSEVGQRITVECYKTDNASQPALGNSVQGEAAIVIAVKDEGQGFSEEDKEKVFGKFQRLSARPTGGESSTGLGLAIVKQLVELHSGEVWVESEGKGRGAAFFVKLPAAPAPPIPTVASANST
ncbi:MAG: tetratricopeptide repeat-containing sensor histidine kinase [Chloroherpetonaceae bacterium]|nr:tetratricopeptide repeat-containing sensor histidine kinase [Chloroherpetonaceae bacterium]